MFFKKKPVCEHDYEFTDKYYDLKLTGYVNGFDNIELYTVRVCKKCMDINEKLIETKYYPTNNVASYDEKYRHLELLKTNKVKTKQEYLLSLLNNDIV